MQKADQNTSLRPRRAEKPLNPAGKVIRDPIHGLIRIAPEDEVVLRLIDTPEFQRLRRLRQLGVSSMTYPGAEHSRFTHSLGVMNFAQRMLEILERRYHGENQVREVLRANGQLVKIAALLHDIGHGPFSHMIERAFDKKAHEKKTVDLILDVNSEIFHVLRKFGVEPQDVVDIIDKTSPHPLLSDIVSSQLDADRMDYILRDALSTGVKYGAYDSEWLLNCLCIGGEPSQPGVVKKNQWRLCLDQRRGLHSAEQLIIARMHMSLQVYFHSVTRGWEAHLLCLFKTAAELAKTGGLPKGTPPMAVRYFRQEGRLDGEDFLSLDESTLLAAMHEWASATARKYQYLAYLANGFLRREKCFECQVLKDRGLEKFANIERRLTSNGLKKNVDWLLDDISFNSYSDFGAVFRENKNKDDADVSTKAILLSSGDIQARARPVESNSTILQAMAKDPMRPDPRIYYLKRQKSKVEKSLE